MKRFLYTMFACVCALFYTTTAQAQTTDIKSGDIITISSGSNYLAVNTAGTGVTNVTEDNVDETCFWVVTLRNGAYIFSPYTNTNNRYLYIARNNLTISTSSRSFTYSNKKLYYSSYYVRLNGTTWGSATSESQGASIELKKVQGIFVDVDPESGSAVKSLKSIVLTSDIDMTSVTAAQITLTGNGITLTGGQELTIAISSTNAKQLVITNTSPLTAGTYTLNIAKGAVKGGDINFLKASYNWTVEAPKFVGVVPSSGFIVKTLDQINVVGDSEMTDVDATKISLVDADGVSQEFTYTINGEQLVIVPTNTLAAGTYTLIIETGAIKSGEMVYPAAEYDWTVDPTMSVTIVHTPGFYGVLDNRGYQKVHTVERTMYYIGNEEELQLRLAEAHFFGYMRWYDYTTDRNITTTWNVAPTGNNGRNNFVELTDGSAHLGWFGWHTTHLVDGSTNNKSYNNIPTIKPWTDGKAHTVACDVSSRTDYEITEQNNMVMRVKEPTLSYRQIFYFKPASEMAKRIADLGSNKFLEVYDYQAPANQKVLLTTEYRYDDMNDTHESELGYFVYNADGELLRVGKDVEATWWFNGTQVTNGTYPTKDYLEIDLEEGKVRTYELIVKANADKGLNADIRLAQFNVEGVSPTTHGPLAGGIELSEGVFVGTKADIETNFQVLAHNDFDFNHKESTDNQLKIPFAWEQSTYGFYNPDLAYDGRDNHDFEIPYYGEYMFVKRADGQGSRGASWISNGGSAKDGYALFVDGTTEPGLVASIVAENVVVCEARTMYCSMWLKNPRTGSTSGAYLPNFRCNIQGRTKDANGSYTNWETLGVFYIGELPNSDATWKQVVFPFTPGDEYNEVRVQLYNFGTGGNGNDFMLDDLTLFVDKSPMSTYQMEPSTLWTNTTLPYTMAVLRVDYQENTENSNELYYQIYNLTDNDVKEPLALEDYLGVGKGTSGIVTLPIATYDPNADENKPSVFNSLDDFSNYLHNPASASGQHFVNVDGTWVMYVVHRIPKKEATSGPYPYEPTNYGVRMSYSEVKDGNWDNVKADCTMDMLFVETQSSNFELRDAISSSDVLDEFLTVSDEVCANNMYFLDLKIIQDLTPERLDDESESGLTYADWLKGIESDEVYAEHSVLEDPTADADFEKYYGYSRAAVTAAIQDLRGKNRTVADATLLTDADFATPANKAIIQDLCAKGYLELYAQSVSFYLGSAETARYWVFPIEGTAVSSNGNHLHDTPEPMWAQISSHASNFNLSIYNYELPDAYTTELPIVRVLASKVNNQMVIEYKSKTWTAGSSQEGDAYLYSTTDEALSAQLGRGVGTQLLQYNCAVDNVNNTITLTVPEGNPTEFKIGEEYIVAVTMRDNSGNATPESGNNDCPVGTWFFDVLLVPDVVTWTGATGDTWNADANWTYVDGETSHHYVPIEGSKVIIPAGSYPTLEMMTVDKEHPHPCPLHVNYPMQPTCGQIYFEPGATIENQHLLNHDKAIVDLVIPQGTWNSVSVPIAGVVTGDMFIPHTVTGTYQGESIENDDPFDVHPFAGSRNSTSAFAFWQSFFNRTVKTLNENGSSVSDIAVEFSETNSFAQTNSLTEPLYVGAGHQLLGFGPDGYTEDNLTIRLPKPDTEYSYYHPNGAAATPTPITREENAGKLIYNPETAIQLIGEDANAEYVMFGNPTMAYIDMQAFLETNQAMFASAYYRMDLDAWTPATTEAQPTEMDRYLAPMRSVMIKLNDGATMPSAAESGIYLKPEHLVADPTVARNNAPSRVAAANKAQVMTIAADVQGTVARCVVASKKTANDSYSANEDALFFSSGVEADVNDATATSPVNMYTVSDRVPMMVDVRAHIDTIPLAMLVMDSYQTAKMALTFTLSAEWDKETYFCDNLTGAKTLITDGMTLEVDLPANHETRYFLEGPDTFDPNGGGDIWSSTDDVQGAINVWAYSQGNGQLTVATNDILKSVEVYDLAGRLIADRTLDLQYSSTSIDTPTGACIVKAVLRDNSVHYLSALVK